jgi:membrane-associated protein
MEHELAQTLSAWLDIYGPAIYPLLFAVIALEIGVAPLFFLPGDPLLFLCGALSAQGGLNPWILMPLFFAATLLGSWMAYGIGALIGRQTMQRNYRWLNRDALARARQFFEGHGAWGLVVTPYVAVLRTFAPLAAGMARMDFGRFTVAVSAGSAFWSVGLVALGYFFGNVPLVREHMGALILSGVALAAAAALLRRLLRKIKRG